MSDIDAKHEARGDVKCEGCGCWTATYTLTLDECYLCPKCGEDWPFATPDEVAEHFGFGSEEHRAALASAKSAPTGGANGEA